MFGLVEREKLYIKYLNRDKVSEYHIQCWQRMTVASCSAHALLDYPSLP